MEADWTGSVGFIVFGENGPEAAFGQGGMT